MTDPPALTVRKAAREDLPALVALLADDEHGRLREDASLPLDAAYEHAFAEIEAAPSQLLVVAEAEADIVGTLQLSFLPGLSYRGAWRGQIQAVRVASRLRGRGLGTQLIEWALARCRERGCRVVQLTSNSDRADAHRFYERLGFARSHAGFNLHLSEEPAR
jgi:GNAT superfamily N-acetyltransferase